MTTTTSAHTTAAQDTGPGAGPVVAFHDVTKNYGAVRAVDGLSLELHPGETVALLGPNGAGKSSTLDLLLGLRPADSGSVRLFGTTPREAVAAGRVGAMLQSGGLMEDVTVREIVALGCALHPRRHPVEEVLGRAGITEIADRMVNKLSGGQEQRVRFALATAGHNDLIVLDEPTTGMDVTSRQAFWATRPPRAAPSSSPPTTWKRPTRSPTGSWSSTRAGCSPTARPPRSRPGPGPAGSPSTWPRTRRWTRRRCAPSRT